MATNSERAIAGKGIKNMPEKEQAEHQGRNRIVTDDQVGDALRWLASNAAEIGDARSTMIKKANYVKHLEALRFLGSEEKTIEAKKASVRAGQEWLDATDKEAEAAGEFEKMKALREAAIARIDAWRTESASLRK